MCDWVADLPADPEDYDHDPEAVATVRALVEDTDSTMAARVLAWMTGEECRGETPRRTAPPRAIKYVLKQTDLVARSYGSPCISDVRHNPDGLDADAEWEFREWHEFRRTAKGGAGYREGTVDQRQALDNIGSPVLCTPGAWDHDLRVLYDHFYGLRDTGEGGNGNEDDGPDDCIDSVEEVA